jgi:signal transduction histidine kinase
MRHSPAAVGSRPLLAALGIAAALIAATEVAMIVDGPIEAPWAFALAPLLGLVYCLASLAAWSRRPTNRTCALLTFAGLAWFGSGLSSVGTPGLIAVGDIVRLLPVAVIIHLLFTFPSGVAASRLDRVGIAFGYVAALVLEMPVYLFGDEAPPYDVLTISAQPDVADAAALVQAATASGLCVLIIVSLRRRLNEAGKGQRRAMIPFVAYGVAALVVIPVVGNLLELTAGVGEHAILAGQLVVLAGIPFAAVGTMLRGGFARIGAIEELSAWLGAGQRADVRDALARALGDSSLGLGFRLDDGSLVDDAGQPYSPPRRAGGRGVYEVVVEGRAVAVISFDPTLIGDPAELEAAARVLAVWIERERLMAALLASDSALRRSRVRVIEAADRERRRIARDLHDGLASRLLLLAVQSAGMRGEVGSESPAAGRALDALHDELQASISELRVLVQGMMPAGLIERGLPGALEDLVDRMPLRTRLECRGADGLATEIESAAYFVVGEALANATKHSRGHNLAVRITGDDDRLTIEVADDGVGGAERGAGAGLRSMADRVEAYGGRLVIQSPPAGGSVIRATLPRVLAPAAMSVGPASEPVPPVPGRGERTVA